jgi:hypothetical protein
MKGVRALAFTAALSLLVAPAQAAPLGDQAPVPISEGSWLGALETSCTAETGTTRDYNCDFSGSAPSTFPPGSHCTETPTGPVGVSLQCTASLSASTVGRIGRTGCLSAPAAGQVLTTNGDVTVFSAATQQSYSVPVKVWVTRGAGSFTGTANYPFTAASVSGSFTTDCGELQSVGVFRGQFSIAVVRR